MNRRGRLLLVALLAGIGIGGYVWWSESAGRREIDKLRTRTVEALPSAGPTSDGLADGAANAENIDGEEADEPPEKRLTAEEILGLADAQWNEIEDYHCTTVVFCRTGEETENKILDVVFKKPNLCRNTVIEGANVGSVVTYNAEGVIHGRRGGIFSVIVLTLEPDDDRIRSLRGRRFYETAWAIEFGEMRDLVADGWKLERLDDGDTDGLLCYVIVAKGSSEDTALTHSELWVEQSTHLPRRLINYEGETLVRDAKFTQIEINAGPDETSFSLK